MFKITVLPDNKIIYAKSGDNLAKALASAGYNLLAFCGGAGACGKGKAYTANVFLIRLLNVVYNEVKGQGR